MLEVGVSFEKQSLRGSIMFGIGMPEFIIILVVALVVIGPQKLPGMLRSVGRGLGELKRATNQIKDSVQSEMDKVVEETELDEVKDTLKNEFGGVASSLHKTGPLGMSDAKKLDTLANVLEKAHEPTPSEGTSDSEPSPASSKESPSPSEESSTDSTKT